MADLANNQLPPPLVPKDADLRCFPWTPVNRANLFNSAFHALATDAEWRAGITLWFKSWDQIPAGSLPQDDVQLCRLAELGRDLEAWQSVKARALLGWAPCSDGRLYHPEIALDVNAALAKKQNASTKGKAGASARWQAKAMPAPMPADGTGNAAAIAEAMPAPMPADGNRPDQNRPDLNSSLRSQDARAGVVIIDPNELIEAFEVARSLVRWHAATDVNESFKQFTMVSSEISPDQLLQRIRAYGAALSKGRKGEPAFAVTLQRFLAERMWERYAPAPQKKSRLALPKSVMWKDHAEAEARLRAEMGDEEFETGPGQCQVLIEDDQVVLLAKSSFALKRADDHAFRIERVLGKPVTVRPAQVAA